MKKKSCTREARSFLVGEAEIASKACYLKVIDIVQVLEKDDLGNCEKVIKKLLITWGEWHA
jgi:hypothetical protein